MLKILLALSSLVLQAFVLILLLMAIGDKKEPGKEQEGKPAGGCH
ncbi:hypothetical protein V3F56_06515 [Moorellaceae bacterium AZ2]